MKLFKINVSNGYFSKNPSVFVSPYVKYAKNQLYKIFSLKRKWKNGNFKEKREKNLGKKQKKKTGNFIKDAK